MFRLSGFLLFLVFGPLLSAQQNFPLFQHELGIDLWQWAESRPGATITWKYAPGAAADKPWQNRLAFRLSGGFDRENAATNAVPMVHGDSLIQRLSSDPLKRRYFGFVGLEAQLTRRRWRFFFGGELGYRNNFYTADVEKRISHRLTGEVFSSYLYQSEIRTHEARAVALGGVQFFFGRHWSIGVDLGLEGGVDFINGKTLRQGQVDLSNDSVSFVFETQLIRQVQLSYHFGPAKIKS